MERKVIQKYIRWHDPFAYHRLCVWLKKTFKPKATHEAGTNSIRKVIRVYNAEKKSDFFSEAAILKLQEIAIGVGDYSKENSEQNKQRIKHLLQVDSPKLYDLRDRFEPPIHWLKTLLVDLSKKISISPDLLKKIINLPLFFSLPDFYDILKKLGKDVDEKIVNAIFDAGVTYPINAELKKLEHPLNQQYLQMTFCQADIVRALKAIVILANNHCLNEKIAPETIEAIISKPNAKDLAENYSAALRPGIR